MPELAQAFRINLDPFQFHGLQHRRHPPLESFVDGEQAFGAQARLQHIVEPQGHVRVLGGVAGGGVDFDLGETFLRLAGPGHLLERDRSVAEVELRQLIHAVTVQPAFQHVGDQHGVFDGEDLDAVAGQHRHVILGVLGHLQHSRVFQQRLQLCEGFAAIELAPVFLVFFFSAIRFAEV